MHAFFGNYIGAQAAGRDLLFALGSADKMELAAVDANQSGLGYLEKDNCYWIARSSSLDYRPYFAVLPDVLSGIGAV